MGMMMRVVDHTPAPRTVPGNWSVTTRAPSSRGPARGPSWGPARGPALRPPAGRMAPGLNGSVFGGASRGWPVRGLGADSIHSQQAARGGVFPNGGVGLVLGLALGAAAGGMLLVMAVLAVLLRKWYGTHHKASLEFDMDDRLTIASSRSAPNTRSNTPDSMRRSKTNLMRSITMDMISIETEMTSVEAVQPESSPEDASSYTGSTQTLLSERHLVGVNQQPEALNDAFELEEYGDAGRASNAKPPSLAYNIVYDPSTEKLTVNVIKASNLTGRYPNNRPRDPFVKVCVLPDEKAKQQGRITRRSLDPVFNDSFAFYVSRREVCKRTVRISVYDIDRRRLRHTLGHVFVSLHGDDLVSGEVRWAQLQRRSHKPEKETPHLGFLQLTLTCLPAAEEIHLTVGTIKGLQRLLLATKEGLRAQVCLLESGRPSCCQKTSVVYDINPQGHVTFSEPMRFAVPIRQLDACSFRISLDVVHADADPHDPGVELGHVTVGSHLYAQREGLAHWSRMVTNARTPITDWLRIAPPLMTPSTSPDD